MYSIDLPIIKYYFANIVISYDWYLLFWFNIYIYMSLYVNFFIRIITN